MKIYKIKCTFGNNPIVAGLFKRRLPGTECSVCGMIGGYAGCEYPIVDLSSLKNITPCLEAWAAPQEKLEEFRSQVRQLVPAHLPLPPGTRFGPVVGEVLVKTGDFASQKPMMTPLISREAYDRLRDRGIRITGVPAELTYRTKLRKELLVLHVEQRARWDESNILERRFCNGCKTLWEKLHCPPSRVKRSSVPVDADLFRVDWQTMVVHCTERFKRVVIELMLTDIMFEEVPLSDG